MPAKRNIKPVYTFSKYAPAIILPLGWLFCLRCFTFNGQENSMDAFYHVSLADFGWNYFTATSMPHVELSVWADGFSDKELLFHLILSWVRQCGRLLGIPLFPFHFPSLFFNGLVICGFIYAAFRFKARYLCFFSMMLMAAVPLFSYRTLMLRPHNLALFLMLLSCVFFVNIKRPADYWKPFLFGMLFAWAYSNPHFVLLSAVAFAFPRSRREIPHAILLPLCCFAGITAGFIIHPQFPHTFINWKIQCIDVPLCMLTNSQQVYVGNELLSKGIKGYFDSYFLVAVVLFNIYGIFLAVQRYGLRKSPRWLIGLAIVSMVTYAGMGFSIRTVEYACPFNILLAAILWSRLIEQRVVKRYYLNGKIKWAIYLLGLTAIALATANCFYKIKQAIPGKFSPLREYAEWVRNKKLPAGVKVANIIWSDFPVLLYSTPRQRYLWGMEPMFGYAVDPERVVRIEKLRTGQVPITPEKVRKLVKSTFVFVSIKGWRLAGDMAESGCKIIYQGPDGWLFYLAE